MDDLAVITHFLNGCPNLHMTRTFSAVRHRPAFITITKTGRRDDRISPAFVTTLTAASLTILTLFSLLKNRGLGKL